MFGNISFTASPYTFKTDKSSLPSGSAGAATREPLILTFPACDLRPTPGSGQSTPRPQPLPVPDPAFGTSGNPEEFLKKLRRIKRLIDVQPEHLRALNVAITPDLDIDQLVPSAAIVPSEETPEHDPRTSKIAKFFAERLTELTIENEAAFDTLARLRRDLKLGHFYRFFQSVELVNSYYNPAKGPTSGMPDRFREDLVKNFLEPLGWGFGIRYNPPRQPAKVALVNSLFQARLDLVAYLPPTAAEDRKAGIVEGPVYGVQCRHEENFTCPGSRDRISAVGELPPVSASNTDTAMLDAAAAPKTPTPTVSRAPSPPPTSMRARKRSKKEPEVVDEFLGSKGEEKTFDPRDLKELRRTKGNWREGDVWDLAREVSALLAVAQERRKAAKKPGEIVKKCRYRVVGREQGWWDDVYLISSIHSHISISHLRISDAYLRFLETNRFPNANHSHIQGSDDWAGLHVRRTKWWNLLDPKDRCEAAVAVGSVMNRMCKDEELP